MHTHTHTHSHTHTHTHAHAHTHTPLNAGDNVIPVITTNGVQESSKSDESANRAVGGHAGHGGPGVCVGTVAFQGVQETIAVMATWGHRTGRSGVHTPHTPAGSD